METVAVLTEHRQRQARAAAQARVTLTDQHYIFAATTDGTTPRKPSTMSNRYKGCATAWASPPV
ncbi:hypothetical protein [Actinophytocola sp.]|uniref:hypothetical protein n=1 Tax=Actinophytocola sp. TaxID=1872138 RepID=UPI002D806A54|nr:hypothetical protein [Actinophytocola sp.]HET9143617.1 hypothetical protein [Actinophytocola sp.]